MADALALAERPVAHSSMPHRGDDIVTNRLSDAPAVSLAALIDVAEFMVRQDLKYVVTPQQLNLVLDSVDGLRVLEIDGKRRFGYRSLYFDTPDAVSYLGAARRRPDRFKVRTREYLGAGDRFVEVKLRNRCEQTEKFRIPRVPNAPDGTFDAEELDFLAGFGPVAPHRSALRPTLVTEYQRTTGLVDDSFRMTIDFGVRMALPGPTSVFAGGSSVSTRDAVLIETKGLSGPTAVDHVLWRIGVRPQPMSKYATGMARLRPELPANKWHRLLRQLTPQAAA